MIEKQSFPLIRDLGLSGTLVTFANQLSDEANRAAMAFRAAIEAEDIAAIHETSTSLTSVFISYDPYTLAKNDLHQWLSNLLESKNWAAEPLANGRHLFRIPAAFGDAHGPQLVEAANLAGVTEDQAIADFTACPLRVMTIGFAPGQPYLGSLPQHWNIPRQTTITDKVPAASLVVAVRQIILFNNETPTGWRRIGQTAFRNFRPNERNPFALSAGDEIEFVPVSAEELREISENEPNGGAEKVPLP